MRASGLRALLSKGEPDLLAADGRRDVGLGVGDDLVGDAEVRAALEVVVATDELAVAGVADLELTARAVVFARDLADVHVRFEPSGFGVRC